MGVDTVNLEIADQEEITEAISKSSGFVMGTLFRVHQGILSGLKIKLSCY